MQLPLTSHLIAFPRMSILPLNPLLIATPIVKLHHGRNLHPCHLVVIDEFTVLNHAQVMQFRNERVKKLLVKVKNVMYDGREQKVFAFHSPSSTIPFFFRKFLYFYSQNLGP